MIDKSSKYVPVMFYGNVKRNVTTPAYKLSYIYNVKIDLNDEQTSPIIMKNNINDVDEKYNLTYELSISTYLPILSDKNTWLKKISIKCKNDIIDKIKLYNDVSGDDIISRDELDEIEDSVNLLSINDAEASYMKDILLLIDKKYAENYDTWIKVIWALANTSQRYKSLAYLFSQRCPEKYSRKAIDDIWDDALVNSKNNPITKRTLIHWARETNPDRFKAVTDKNYQGRLLKYALENDGIIEHSSVSSILYLMLEDKFVTDKELTRDNEKIYWYEFITDGQDHIHGEIYKWRKEKNPTTLHLYISDHLPKVYKKVEDMIKEHTTNETDENKIKWLKMVYTRFKKCRHDLGNNSNQSSIINQCIYRFMKRGFIKSLDDYENVIGVGNGVLILSPEPKLIRGFHDYKISSSISADYMPYDPRHPKIIEIENAFKNIFIENDVYEKMMMMLSTGVDRRPVDPLLVMLVGGGSNGKSTIIESLVARKTPDKGTIKILGEDIKKNK